MSEINSATQILRKLVSNFIDFFFTIAKGRSADRQEMAMKQIRRIELSIENLVNTIFGGEYRSAFKGQGMEFDGVREYQQSDEIRSIDWNITARMGKPYIKKYVEERHLEVVLLIDISGSSKFGSGDRTKVEFATEIAALIAFSALRNEDKVTLVCFTDAVELFVPPGKGKKHVLRLIRDMLYFEPKSSRTNIDAIIEHINRVIRQKSVIFLLSDFKSSIDYEKRLKEMAKRHDLIAMSITDPLEVEIPSVGLIELEDSETGEKVLIDTDDEQFRKIYRKQNIRELSERKKLFRTNGINLIELRTDLPYVKPLVNFFRSYSRGAR